MFISESKKRGMVAHFSGHESRQVLSLPNKTGKALAYSCKDPAESKQRGLTTISMATAKSYFLLRTKKMFPSIF